MTFHDIQFGPTTVDIEADDLRDAMQKMEQLYSLHQDARFLEAHIRFFYDVEPMVVPSVRDDTQGHVYRGFQCLNTGCNITFKEKQGGAIYPGRYAAYKNGDDRPKLYDPARSHQEILQQVGPDTPFVRRFQVRVNGNGGNGRRSHAPPRGQSARGASTNRSSGSSGNGGSGQTPFDELSPMNKVKRVRATVKAASLADRPQKLTQIATWKENLPDPAREEAEQVIVDFATEDAYDARMVEIDTELEEQDEEEAFMEELEAKCCEVGQWPPQFREAARAMIEAHAPDSYDVEAAINRNSEPEPAQ